MCVVTATHSTLVNNVLLILVVVLSVSTAVSKFQAQNNLDLLKKPRQFAGFCFIKKIKFCSFQQTSLQTSRILNLNEKPFIIQNNAVICLITFALSNH